MPNQPDHLLLRAYADARENGRLDDAAELWKQPVEDERDRLHAEQLIAWAIGEIANDNYRQVLELTYLKQLPADAIAAQLGISIENVYARRSRGLKELERILRDLRSCPHPQRVHRRLERRPASRRR